jgi:predicted Zn-dependent protease
VVNCDADVVTSLASRPGRPIITLTARLTALLIVAVLGLGCTASEGRPAQPMAVPPPPAGRSVYLAPVGDFLVSDAQALAAHYYEKFGMRIGVLPVLAVPPAAWDATRRQVIAERIIDAIGAGHRVAANPGAIVIGLVSDNMYIAAETWDYAYGLRLQGHLAVVSTARLGDLLGSDRMRRLQKMVTKDIGILYFGLPQSDDPGSVLYRNVNGPGDLDRMSEDF